MKNLILPTCIGTLLLVGSCTKESVTTYDCTGTTPNYKDNVKPILDASCALSSCHSSASKAAGIDLSNYGSAKAAGSNASFLGSIQHKTGYDPMPRGGLKLSEATIKTLSCWVQNGMAN